MSKSITAVSLSALAIVLLTGCSGGEREPTYHGKTVKQWAAALKSSQSADERLKAAEALGEIGPALCDER